MFEGLWVQQATWSIEVPQQNFSYLPIPSFKIQEPALQEFSWEEVDEVVQNWVPPEMFEIFEDSFSEVPINPVEPVKDSFSEVPINPVEQVEDSFSEAPINLVEQVEDSFSEAPTNPVEAKNDETSLFGKFVSGVLFVFIAYLSALAMPHHPSIYS